MSCMLFDECLGRLKGDVVSRDFRCLATAMQSVASECKDVLAD